jgi:alkylation response protein AidB-like acyl-CoA dehydrogenase
MSGSADSQGYKRSIEEQDMVATVENLTGEAGWAGHQDNDEEREFRLRARLYMEGNLPRRVPGELQMSFGNEEFVETDRRIQRALWDGGLAGITVPKAYGGQGLDRRFEAIFYEEAEPYRLAWQFATAFNIALPVLLGHGSEQQKQKYIPRILNGEQLWTQMLSEPSGGSDLAGLLTRAELKGDTWLLNGSKIWTSRGHISDMALCLARTDPTVRKHAGLTMFIINMHTPGLTINPIRLVHGGSDFCQEFLDDVEVPDADRIGAVNDGWTVAQTQLSSERSSMARGWHMGVRPAKAAEIIELSPAYVARATELGLAKDPVARGLLGEAFVNDAIYHLTGHRVSQGIANKRLPASTATIPSLLVARTDVKRTALLSALTGPAGVAAEKGGAQLKIGLDRVTTHRIGGGTVEMQLNLVAERHLELPREPAVDRDIPFNQIKNNAPPRARH